MELLLKHGSDIYVQYEQHGNILGSYRQATVATLVSKAEAGYSSGFYLDNGLDQTVRERLLDHKEHREMQNEILNLLGLPARPGANKNHSSHSHKIDKKGSAPKFLLDVYQSLLDEQDAKKSKSEFELSGEDLHAIHESDVIMSFISRNAPKSALRHQKGHRFWFDVSQVPIGETIVAAELRVFRIHPDPAKARKQKYIIMLSQLVQRPEGEGLKKLVELPIDDSHEGWLLFNVTGPLTDWVTSSDSNLGLMLTVLHHHTGHDVKPEDAGLVTAHIKSTEKQPFMVAFFKSSPHSLQTTLPMSARGLATEERDEEQSNDLEADMLREAQNHQLHSRSRRDTRRKKKTADTSHMPPDTTHYKQIFTEPVVNQWPGTSCQMKSLYVSFTDLGWKPRTVPKPCCAPLRLSAISVLYYLDASSNVILKQYKNMVVKS
ncbi:hypothetical protein B566_EDAN009739, partial [Ephemera danica]